MSETQTRSHRQLALDALAAYDLKPERVRLRHDSYNVTYEVRGARGARYALRISRPAVTAEDVRAEVAWCDALAEDTDVRLLRVVRTREGEGVALSHGRACVLSTWVSGAQRSRGLTPNMLEAVGRTMALMHRHGRQWTPPEGWSRPPLRTVWLSGDPDPIPGLPEAHRGVFREAHDALAPVLDGLWRGDACHVLHADLHQGNYRFSKGHNVGVIDFDDCSVGHPAQDAAISFYYLRRLDPEGVLRAAFQRGYRALEPWPLDAELLQALLVWRALGLCGSVMHHENPEVRAYGDRLVPSWADLCAQWLGTLS